jgi:hypothetical protein
MNRDPDLDPLRSRPDFQLLMMDLAMPAEPFARPHEGPSQGEGATQVLYNREAL